MGRLSLQTLLENTLGSRNVYYQPPSSVSIRHPAIVYKRVDIQMVYASDESYLTSRAYEVVLITDDPDSPMVSKIAELPYCRFNRHYTA